ncbi:hypothetical protein ACONGJ_003591 [Edwardsiella piscicida]
MDGIITVVVIFFVIGIIAEVLKPRRCDICGTPFKRKYFTWEIDGKKNHLCPKCNSKMEKRKSDQSFRSRFG